MSYFAQMMIAYAMFKGYFAATFGSGVNFPSPMCPQPVESFVR